MNRETQAPSMLDEYIHSINADHPVLDQITSLDVDSAIKLAKQNNENARIKTILDVWTQQQEAERKLRNTYAKCFMVFLGIQIVILNIVFIFIGFGIMNYEKWTVNIFIISVFGEIISTISIIVRNLFKTTNKEMIELIKEQK